LSLLLPMASMAQVIYTYDAVPTSTTINDNACTSVTINVPDTFNVGNAHVAIGVDVTHTYRGDLRLEVDPPSPGEGNKIFLDRITGDCQRQLPHHGVHQ
jgi:subtilisin-like proprotein convertase family protein